MFTAATMGLAHFIPETISDDGKDFLSRCLVLDPSKRATCKELQTVSSASYFGQHVPAPVG
jgi:serine/threonine protein kinase